MPRTRQARIVYWSVLGPVAAAGLLALLPLSPGSWLVLVVLVAVVMWSLAWIWR